MWVFLAVLLKMGSARKVELAMVGSAAAAGVRAGGIGTGLVSVGPVEVPGLPQSKSPLVPTAWMPPLAHVVLSNVVPLLAQSKVPPFAGTWRMLPSMATKFVGAAWALNRPSVAAPTTARPIAMTPSRRRRAHDFCRATAEVRIRLMCSLPFGGRVGARADNRPTSGQRGQAKR